MHESCVSNLVGIGGWPLLRACVCLTKLRVFFCVLQHLEIMMWCIRHQFLKHVRSRYPDCASWSSSVRERKSAAVKRAWPAPMNSESSGQSISSLFIEDALSNLDSEQGYADKDEGESLLAGGGNSFLRSKLHGLAGCYPFENLRTAIDLLFLQGNSDVVVAKQAIVSYLIYIF